MVLVNAQDTDHSIKVSGEITSLENNEPIPFVHIINTTKQQGLTADHTGHFQFLMHRGDTLVFSSVGFEKYTWTLSEDDDREKVQIKIALKPSVTELGPVEVFAYKNAETFKKEFLALELPEKQEKIYIPGSYEGPRKEYKPTILNPMSFVYGMFDKKAKERTKLVEVQQETAQWKQMRKKYDFIKEIAEIEDEELEEFLAFCQIDFHKIEVSTEYELALAINTCLPDYKSSRK